MEDGLHTLRRALTEDQRVVLDGIWTHYSDSTPAEWPLARSVHLMLDRKCVIAALESLPPGAVFREKGGAERYGLSFLGVLLTRRGESYEDLLIAFLEHMRKCISEDRNVNTLSAATVTEAGFVPEDQVGLFGHLVMMGGFYGHTFSGGPNWTCGIPDNADELLDVKDLRVYVRERALETGRVTVQGQAHVARAYSTSGKAARGDFWFVLDPALRKQLSADRQELIAVHNAKAWKSTVILAGGLLEGMLLDVLSRRRDVADAAYKKLKKSPPPDLDRWTLNDLVEVASAMSALHKGAIRLSHALREFRDLVHPGRQLREGIKLTQDEADIAISVVNICFRELGEYEDRSGT